ncbi:galactitol-1-phosphate 5-dehydrogenase [Thermoanaerobacter mathranii]|uniref:galactitol-1-phosphate 5-dehydrogenase n=1 Tax=Thermoanaerobacter mathranii TaxID=583357 RepID=UPI003D6B8F68
MKAGILYAKNDIRYEEYPDPVIKDDEVVIKIRATGICGSDVPRVLEGRVHYFPIVLGHEFAGEIVETGKNVKSIKIGERVVGTPLLPCFKCDECQKGNYSLCKNYSFIGSKRQGSFAEYIALPARNVIKLGPEVSFEQGALFEPATVALHGLYRVNFHGGEDVAILGGGTIGIFAMQYAKIYGAKRVFVFDIDNSRLELAKRLGADVTINTLDKNYKEIVNELTYNRGFGFIFETAGNPVTMQIAFELAGNKSNICFIGTTTKNVTFTPELLEKMNRKEFTLTGSWMSYSAPFPGKEWELTSHFFATKQLKFDEEIIYKKFPLSRIKEAFDMYKTPGLVKGKIMLVNE